MDDREGGSAPSLPKRPASVSIRHQEDKQSGAPMRSPPPRPTSKPPALPQRPTSINSAGDQNGISKEVPRLPPPPMKTRGGGNSSTSTTDHKAGSTRKRPEITIVSARPMAQVGFREETGVSGLSSPEGSQHLENTKPVVTEIPKLPPPRPKSITSPRTGLPPPPSPPGQSEIKTDENMTNLIDLSNDPVTSEKPVPKPRPKPAPRVLSNNTSLSNSGSGELTPNTESEPVTTVPSSVRPSRPTIIRSRASETPQVSQNSEDSTGTKLLPSYIKTTASNDASVNELKAAFEKRQSAFSQPVPKPKPNPKPDPAQKPTKALIDNNIENNDDKAVCPNPVSELVNDDLNASPTPPSRRKRPTIIRPSTGIRKELDTNVVGRVQMDSNKPLPSSQAHADNTCSNRITPDEQSPGVAAPTRPTPASRKTTPPGVTKSVSADELRSCELSLPPKAQDDNSITPPPRKRKTGPPRPTQRPLSGSQSSSSLSEKSYSAEKLSKTSPPTRPPSVSASKPTSANSSQDQAVKVSESSSRRVIIHEVYPQSEAPKLPPRPGPGHPLFHYMMDCPYGIAVATNDYQSLQTDELSFNEGDLIVLLKRVDSLWFYGKNGGIEGIFPANFVKVVEPLSGQGVDGHDGGAVGGESSSSLLQLPHEKPDTFSGPRCRARFDYDGEGEEDLVFEEGDVIQIVEHVANDWLRGKLRGQTGIFPSTFVEIIEDLPPTPADVSPIHFDGFEDYGSTATAMFDFSGTDEELKFKTGDKITVISVVSSDWLYGETNGMKGQFPSAFISRIPSGLPHYVSPLKEQPVTEPPLYMQQVEEPELNLIQTDTGDDEAYCIAIHNYPGQSAEDLSFKEADKIILLEWINTEWLKGKLENSGKVGIFPAEFVTIIKELKTPPPKPSPDHKTKTKVKALYVFTGENDTELSFKEGEIIDMYGDMADSDEWREGELRGRTGLFPVSFVEELNIE